LIALLCIGTGLPWERPRCYPTSWAPLLVLSLYLLGFHSTTLGRPQKLALIAVAILATVSHASHLALAAGLPSSSR